MARLNTIALSDTADRDCESPKPLERAATTPLRAGLAAAVVELQHVAAGAEGLQQKLSPILRRGGDGVQAGQALDELTQQLHGLADFLIAMARDCPLDWRFDLARAGDPLRLHAQKLRLVNGRADPAASGELELW